MAALALFILLLVAAVTAGAWGRYGRDLAHNRMLSQARQHAQEAQRASDPAIARSHWESVLAILADDNHPDAVALRTEAQKRAGPDGRHPAHPIRPAGGPGPLLCCTPDGCWQWVDLSPGDCADNRYLHRLSEGPDEILLNDPGLIDIAWNQPVRGLTRKALFILGTGGRLWTYDLAWPENPRRAPFVSPPGK